MFRNMSVVAARSGPYWVEAWGAGGAATEHQLLRDGTHLRWSDVRRGLERDGDVRAVLTETLRAADGAAFFWECVPWRAEADPLFAFVTVPSDALARPRPDPEPFAEHLHADRAPVHAFPNLGGDAQLVVPAPVGRRDVYAHLADFVRGAPRDQVDALWVALAEQIALWRRTPRPLWVSTSGLGVSWVHVRLDGRPKYITHAPYR